MGQKEEPNDPRALYEQARGMEIEARELEATAIRLALERSAWMVKLAAELLGMPRGTLRTLMNGRYRELRDEAAKKRKAAGYVTGNPAPWLAPEDED